MLLAVTLLLSAGSALAATQWGPTEPKSWLEDTSPVTLDVYVNMNWWSADWSDPVAQNITAQTGISCNVITPVADDDTQLIMMLNSGDVPDIIITELYKTDLLNMMIESGVAAPLDELAEKYAPEMFTNCDPDVWEGYRQEDGHTYWLTGFGISDYYMEKALEYNRLVQANQGVLLLREDYYQEIGSPDISTPEKFFDALCKMHENHPDKIAYYEGDSNVSAANNRYHGSAGMDHFRFAEKQQPDFCLPHRMDPPSSQMEQLFHRVAKTAAADLRAQLRQADDLRYADPAVHLLLCRLRLRQMPF